MWIYPGFLKYFLKWCWKIIHLLTYLLHCYILHIYHYVPVYRQHLVTLGFFYCKCLSFPHDFSCFSVDIGSMDDLGVFIIPNQHKNNSLCLYFDFDFELSFSFSSHYFFLLIFLYSWPDFVARSFSYQDLSVPKAY